MSPHGSIFPLSSTLHLCLRFLFQLFFFFYSRGLTWHQTHRMIQGRGGGMQKQKNRNIHFTEPADYSCSIMHVPSSPSVLSLPFLSYCGNVLQVCCIPTCKSRGIIDFLTSFQDNQRIESQARCDGGAALPRASVPSHRLLLRGRHE